MSLLYSGICSRLDRYTLKAGAVYILFSLIVAARDWPLDGISLLEEMFSFN